MLSIIEKAKLLKEFRELRLALTGGSLGIVDKARKLKRFREIRVLLGGQNASQPAANNPVYQRVIDGEEITRELLIELNEASLKDPDPFNAQLVQASQITLKFMRDLVMKSQNQEAA